MRGVIAGVVFALAAAFVLMPWLIRALRSAGIGQPIHDAVVQHAAKAGTPVMGGLIIPIALLVGYAGAHIAMGSAPTSTGLVVAAVIVGGTGVGAVDDLLKIRRARNLGLREAQKAIMQLVVIGCFVIAHLHARGACTTISVTRCNAASWDVGPIGWAAFATVVFFLTSNAVNFTDGLEGQLAGSAAMTFTALSAIAFWQFRHPSSYGVIDALDLSIISAALAAGCIGLLWWNGNPMTVFMGDAGSLAIGSAIAALALTMNVALLIPVLGALYVAEGGSSFIQRFWFRATHGRRVFKMAPLHHHFELLGWPESTIVVRFWIVAGVSAAAGGAIFYADALRHP